MFRIGFAEVLLFLIIFFLIAPMEIPKVLRKIGELLGTFKKMRKEWGVFEKNEDLRNIRDDLQEIRQEFAESGLGRDGGGGHISPAAEEERRFEHDIQKHGKLLFLDYAAKEYDFSNSLSLFRFLFDQRQEVREKAAEVLLTEPVLGLERREGDFSRDAPVMGAVHNPFEGFYAKERVDQFTALCSSVPDKYFRQAVEQLASLPGIGNLDLAAIFQGEKRACYEEFRNQMQQSLEKRFPLQVTVSPSYTCNLECPYCFSNELRDRFPEAMPIERFRSILDTVNSEGKLKRVNIFGGEPTAFPGLQTFITELEQRELTFSFSTNGTTPAEAMISLLQRKTLEMVTFHIERDDFYSPDQLSNILENIRNAARSPATVILRYNIVDPERRNWDFLDKYRDIMSEFIFSFGLVFPSSSGDNTHIPLENLRNYTDKILSLISFIAERPYSRPYRIVFAKPFPLCFFKGDELSYVLKNSAVKNICEIDKNNGTNNLVFNPDGSFHPCMALTSDAHRYPFQNNLDAFPGTYHSQLHHLQKTPLLSDCAICSLHKRGICQAACYAYTL